MAYLLLFLVIILGYICPKNRFVTIIQLSYIWIIVAFNTASPDFLNNELMYINIDSGIYVHYEPLYVLLIKLGHMMNLDFSGFRCIVAGLLVALIGRAIHKNKNVPNNVVSLFIIYPVIMFASGLRGAIAYGITINAIVDYVMTDEGKHRIKFIASILLATMIHYSYVVFIIIYFVKRPFKIKVIFRTIVIETIAMMMIRYGVLYRIVSRFLQSEKALSWLNPSAYNHPSLIVDCMLSVLMLTMAYCFYRYSRYQNADFESFQISQVYTDNLIWLLIAFMPLLYLNVTFERYIAVIFSALIIFFCDKPFKNDVRKGIWVFFTFLMNVAFYYVIHSNIYLPIFINNMIL